MIRLPASGKGGKWFPISGKEWKMMSNHNWKFIGSHKCSKSPCTWAAKVRLFIFWAVRKCNLGFGIEMGTGTRVLSILHTGHAFSSFVLVYVYLVEPHGCAPILTFQRNIWLSRAHTNKYSHSHAHTCTHTHTPIVLCANEMTRGVRNDIFVIHLMWILQVDQGVTTVDLHLYPLVSYFALLAPKWGESRGFLGGCVTRLNCTLPRGHAACSISHSRISESSKPHGQ